MKRRTVKKRDRMRRKRLEKARRNIARFGLKLNRAIYLMALRVKQCQFPPGGIVSPATVDGAEYIVPTKTLRQHEPTNQRRGI